MSSETVSARPRRSVLYMPGSNARALEKAKSLPADALILDLEDAVAPDAKEEARVQVCSAVSGGGYGKREIIIRVNGLDTSWGADDIAAAAAAGPDAILVPKVNDAADVQKATEAIAKAAGDKPVQLWAMMETPLAMLNAKEIAAEASKPDARLSVFVMGTNDLAKELFCDLTRDRLSMVTSLGLSMLAARAYGVAIIDGVYNAIKDEDGFIQVCNQGAELGFDGKTLIHPSQIGPCNRVFSPATDDVTWARRIIEAFGEPENKGKGVIKVDGKMVELLHAESAQRLVAIADAIAELEAG